jgi:hypothetical protein
MRSDMAKVVTEAPRRGHSNPSKKHGKRLTRDEVDAIVISEADDDAAWGPPQQVAAHRAKISRNGQYGYNHKEFSDVLNPLRRYLRKQVGRPWNKIYSEMNRSLDKRTVAGLHIWDHVAHEVETHTYLGTDGKTVYRQPRWRGTNEGVPVGGLYVDPRSGLLCAAPGYYERERRWYRARKAAQPVTEIRLTDTRRLEQIDGLWYESQYGTAQRQIPAVVVHRGTHHEYVMREARVETYDVRLSKRQLSRAELRRHGLENARKPQ